MIKKVCHTKSYKQEGLVVSLKDGKMTITKGKLVYDETHILDKGVNFNIDEETVIIFLVKDLITNEILVAASDGSIDKNKYKLIERIAWKDNKGEWERLSVEPYPTPPKAKPPKYEGLNKKDFKESLKIHKRQRRIIGKDGKIRSEDTGIK